LLELLADRDRIVRDLHDHVIQRLYAAGMSLQGTLRLVTGQDARGRIHQVVDQLDDTIRDIRTTIFDLHTTGEDKPGSLRRRLLDAAAAVSAAGAPPSVRMSGAVDTRVPAAIAEHAEAVVREGVSNAVRHAHASAITVTAEAGEDLVIEVIDNGIGIPDGVAQRPSEPGTARGGLPRHLHRRRPARRYPPDLVRATAVKTLRWNHGLTLGREVPRSVSRRWRYS
jgi:signal transduction histidine kinase